MPKDASVVAIFLRCISSFRRGIALNRGRRLWSVTAVEQQCAQNEDPFKLCVHALSLTSLYQRLGCFGYSVLVCQRRCVERRDQHGLERWWPGRFAEQSASCEFAEADLPVR